MSNLSVLFWNSLRLALKQLVRHKVRSFLTMLGLFIGVGGVVAIVSLGEGLRGFFNQSMAAQASADLIYIMPDAPFEPGGFQSFEKGFRNRDLELIRKSEYVKSAIAGHMLRRSLLKHGWRSARVDCNLVSHYYFPMENWEVERGRMYTSPEEHGSRNVVVVGADIHGLLYDEGEQLLGSFLTINGIRFEVIGEMKSRSAMEGGQTGNRMIHIPLQTGQDRLLGKDELWWIAAKAISSEQLDSAKEDIAARLRASRRIRAGKDDDFSITTPDDFAEFGNTFVNTLITVFGVVAVIALVVGGIGVMNIMLVSVKERTREIGLRKALGATSAQITWQFLVEAVTLTIFGGLGGLLCGYGLGGGVALLMKATLDVFWMPQIPLNWMIAVLVTSLVIGLTFGVYPAWRAGKLDPINALRYE